MSILETIYDLLDLVANESSTNNKIKLLSSLPENSMESGALKLILILAYDSASKYYIDDVKFLKNTPAANASIGDKIIEHLTNTLAMLQSRTVTGNAAKAEVERLASIMTFKEQSLLTRIIKTDLRCGFAATTVNKVFPDLIYIHPYMRCSELTKKTLKKLVMPVWSEPKMDGMYADHVITDSIVRYSRQYNTINVTGNADQAVVNYLNSDDPELQSIIDEVGTEIVLSGEMLVRNANGTIMERETGNGYINRNEVSPDNLVFVVWDIIPHEHFKNRSWNKPRTERLALLTKLIKLINKNVPNSRYQLTESLLCHTLDEAIDHFKKIRAIGGEGTVIKNGKGLWKDGTSTDQFKLKVKVDCDMKIVGFTEGEGQHAGKVGSVTVQSSDGLVECGVSGFTVPMRQYITDNIDQLIDNGTIMSVYYNGVTESAIKPDMYSLYLPRYAELRSDKTTADDLPKIIKQLEQFDILENLK